MGNEKLTQLSAIGSVADTDLFYVVPAAGGTQNKATRLQILTAATVSSANGKDITLTASSGNGTNKNGGNVVLTPGVATGVGTNGSVVISNGVYPDYPAQLRMLDGAKLQLNIQNYSGGLIFNDLYNTNGAMITGLGYVAVQSEGRIGFANGPNLISYAPDAMICRVAAGVIGSPAGNWIQHSMGRARVTADVTNATTTMANLTDLTITIIAGRKYFGSMVIKCNNSVAAEGIKLDFDGSSATMTNFWAAGGVLAGGASIDGTVISTSLAGDLNWTTITGETVITIDFSMVVNAAGTFIPRFAENSHSSGTATVELGSYVLVEDSAN